MDVIIHETLSFSDNIEPHDIDDTMFLQPAVIATTSPSTDNLPTSIDKPSASIHGLSYDSNSILQDPISPGQSPDHDTYYEADSVPVQNPDIQIEPTQSGVLTTLQGEIIPAKQEVLITQQEDEMVLPLQTDPPHSHMFASGSTSLSNTIVNNNNNNDSNLGNDDNNDINNDDNTLGGEHIAQQDTPDSEIQLKPRNKLPPIRYGEWIKYDNIKSNVGSVGYIATQSMRIHEPKTY